MRGGVSIGNYFNNDGGKYSPHAWGCFYSTTVIPAGEYVFPTCVGVFLTLLSIPSSGLRIPHMRGGVSKGSPAL